MRSLEFSVGEYYHVYNRGNNKQLIFRDNRDWVRFLFLLLYLQSPTSLLHFDRKVSHFIKKGSFGVSEEILKVIESSRFVDLICFVMMRNHFHFILKEHRKGGISRYMHKVSMAYSKYANTKYDDIVGHVFQGTFKAVHIEDNEQLVYLSTYIHKNPSELTKWKGREHDYPWSSYQDYVNNNRWGQLLKPGFVLGQFNSPREYQDEVKTSQAKSIESQ